MASLLERLGMTKAKNILVFDKPEEIRIFDSLAFDQSGRKRPYDFIFSYIFSLEDMVVSIVEVDETSLLLPGGLLYIAFPDERYPGYEKERRSLARLIEDLGVESGACFRSTALRFFDAMSLEDGYAVIGFRQDEKKPRGSGS